MKEQIKLSLEPLIKFWSTEGRIEDTPPESVKSDILSYLEWLGWQNERIEQLQKALEMNIEIATLELDYEGSLRILRQIADFSRTALGKEEYPMNKHNTMVYEVNISNGTRWISADIDQILMDLKDLFNKGETAEITCWYSGVPASIMNWKSSEKSGKGGTQ